METAFEKILTQSHKPKMISFLASHPEKFEEAIQLAIADKQPYSWRASWLLWSCIETNDKRMRRYVKDIITILPNRKDNQQRELMKVLEKMQIKEAYEGVLFDHCVSVWKKTDKQASVRFNAFKILVKLTQQHPELVKEIRLLTEHQYLASLSTTASRSIHRLIKELY